jgi:hypothetical protein
MWLKEYTGRPLNSCLNLVDHYTSCDVDKDIELSVKVLMTEQLADSANDIFGDDDLLGDDLFSGDSRASEQDFRDSLTSSLAMCKEEHKNYQFQKSRITPTLENFKSVETSVADFLIENINCRFFNCDDAVHLCIYCDSASSSHCSMGSYKR